MPWFNVDDGLNDHPKILELQSQRHWRGPIALWTLAGAWSSKHLTDGFIPRSVVTRLRFTIDEAARLVRVGLWSSTSDGFQFHDWHDHNPTKLQVLAKRAAVASRVKDWRARHGNAVTDGNVTPLRTPLVTPLVTAYVTPPHSDPIHSDPDPNADQTPLPPIPPKTRKPRAVRAEVYSPDFLAFWNAYPRKVAKGAAWKVWQRLSPPLPALMAALEWQRRTLDWTKDGGAFVPHPATYLNARRWEDERTVKPTTAAKPPTVTVVSVGPHPAESWPALPETRVPGPPIAPTRARVDEPETAGDVLAKMGLGFGKDGR